VYHFLFGGPARLATTTAVIGGLIVAAVVAIVVIVSRDDSPPITAPTIPSAGRTGGVSQSPVAPAKNRGDEIESRDFWLHEPEVYGPVPESFDTDVVNLNVFGSDVSAFLPGELADAVAQFDFYAKDYTLFIVGKVIETAIHQSSFGLEREVVVVDDDGSTAAVIGAPSDAVDTCCFRPGDVVYALVRVAALGDARIAGTKVRRVVYVVLTRDYEASIETVSFPIHSASEISKEITSRAETVGAR
jgi:hypothetical protein